MKKIGVLTSGGDTPGMNAAIRAIFKTSDYYGMRVMGIYHGFQGLMDGSIKAISHNDTDGIIHNGGTILRTARSEEFKSDEGQQKALKVLKAFQIDGVVVIGGDGSYAGALALSNRGIKTVAIPGTIDNDLGYTDYTIGFDTAANSVLGEIYRVRDTMRSHDRYGVIEVMGRACGDIALKAGLAGGVDCIIVPEIADENTFENATKQLYAQRLRGKTTGIVIIAEGAGKAKDFCDYANAKSQIDAKPIVLGYIQRGGQPSLFDRVIATTMGSSAVELLNNNKTSRALGIKNDDVFDMDLKEALNTEKVLDKKLYEINKRMARF